MRRQHIVEIGLAGVMLATPARAASRDPSDYVESIGAAVAAAIASGYRAAPALMLGLVALIALPVAALVVGIAARWRNQKAADTAPPALRDVRPAGALHASLEVMSKGGSQHIDILQDMVRIGREDDNDIRIRSRRVHRYHAAIHREDFGIYRITDLAGEEAGGLSVNGQACEDAELKDGDIIELGPGRLRFHAGLV